MNCIYEVLYNVDVVGAFTLSSLLVVIDYNDESGRTVYLSQVYCFKLDKMATEMHKLLVHAFSNDALGQIEMYNWLIKYLKNG